jgi:hypothetical protein
MSEKFKTRERCDADDAKGITPKWQKTFAHAEYRKGEISDQERSARMAEIEHRERRNRR